MATDFESAVHELFSRSPTLAPTVLKRVFGVDLGDDVQVVSVESGLSDRLSSPEFVHPPVVANKLVTGGQGEMLLNVLEARGVEVPGEVAERIESCLESDTLKRWARNAATADSIDDVFS